MAAPPRRDEGGFSFVELLGGMVLLLMAVAAIYRMNTYGARHRRVDDERQQAFAACRSRLEELRLLPIAALPAQSGTRFLVDVDGDGAGDLHATADNLTGLPGLVTVTTEATSGSETIHRVVVAVVWEGIAGRQTFAMTTLIADRYAQ
jgi:Tfp pilus assembly protein PilV